MHPPAPGPKTTSTSFSLSVPPVFALLSDHHNRLSASARLRRAEPSGLIAGSQLLLIDREYLSDLDLQIFQRAGAASFVGELDVVAAGRDARDVEPFIRIDDPV